jgi:hypothetical protein
MDCGEERQNPLERVERPEGQIDRSSRICRFQERNLQIPGAKFADSRSEICRFQERNLE